MFDITTFERELAALIGRPTDLRPFVCDGSPLECEAFIIGINPATAMSDFWQFWRSGYGFDKTAWFEAYKKDRQNCSLERGKTKPDISKTRGVIEWILEEASPVRCLETNIYSAPTERAADLARAQRVTAPLDFLLTRIKPRVVIVHGKDAVEHILGRHLAGHIITCPHFSRGWSQASARKLGQQIKRECSA